MSVTGELRVSANVRHSKSGPLGNPAVEAEFEWLLTLASGVIAGAADLVYPFDINIAASGTGDLDLNAVLTDAFGASIVGVELVAVFVKADSTNVNNINVGGAASNQVPFLGAVTDKVPVKPGGVMVLVAPSAAGQATITAATGDKFGLANSSSGSAVTGKGLLIMRSA